MDFENDTGRPIRGRPRKTHFAGMGDIAYDPITGLPYDTTTGQYTPTPTGTLVDPITGIPYTAQEQAAAQAAAQASITAQAGQAISTIAGDIASGAKWIIIGIVGLVLLEGLSKVPAPRYSARDFAHDYARRRVKHYRRRAARAVARRIAGD